jgi:hypothetical protein
MAGGLVYYGGRPVRELDTPDSVRAFVAQGGRALVIKRRKLRERVESVVPVEVVASARTGRREVVVVRPLARGGGEAVSSQPPRP